MKLPESLFDSHRSKEKHAQLTAAYTVILTLAAMEAVLSAPPILWVPVAGVGILGMWGHSQMRNKKS